MVLMMGGSQSFQFVGVSTDEQSTQPQLVLVSVVGGFVFVLFFR